MRNRRRLQARPDVDPGEPSHDSELNRSAVNHRVYDQRVFQYIPVHDPVCGHWKSNRDELQRDPARESREFTTPSPSIA